MARVNLSDAGGGGGGRPGPGIHDAVVASCEEKVSRKGDPMFSLKLVDKAKRVLAYDTIMLAGKGVGIGVKKLGGFGVVVKDGDEVQPETLVGRAVRVHLIVDEGDPKYLKVDISGGACCGYTPLESKGGESSKPLSGGKPDDDFADIPF